ncbi:MAG: LamG-like jellyroll fold domain-containing protein [Candidatus Heimdallarchaeaceae archaeon]
MNKSLLFIFCMLLLIGLTSAWEFDNVKSYDGVKKEITINNAFNLPLIGSKLAVYKLEYNTDYCLTNCYAEGTAILYTTGKLFSKLEFEDMLENKAIIKSSKILISTQDTIQETTRPIQEIVCRSKTASNHQNLSDGVKYQECKEEVTGYETTQHTVPLWENYNNEDLIDGTYKWRIEGKKEVQQTVDWIGSSFGERFEEWAIWTASFDLGLETYYNLGNLSENIYGQLNLTKNGNPIFNDTDCIIGDCIHVSNTNNVVTPSNITYRLNNGTNSWNWWVKPTNSNSYMFYYGAGEPLHVYINPTGTLELSGFCTSAFTPTVGIQLNNWTMVSLVNNGTHLRFYTNGTYRQSCEIDNESAVNTLEIGYRTGGTHMIGSLDELGFWNRSLSDGEVSDLYNDGLGLEQGVQPLSTVLNFPADTSSTSNNRVIFNVSSIPDGINLLNVTLFIWNSSQQLQTNFTLVSGVVHNDTIWNLTLSDDTYIWNAVTGGDNGESIFGKNRTLTIDSAQPVIIITNPTFESYGINNLNQTLNWTVTDINSDVCWFDYNGTNLTVLCYSNSSSFLIANGDTDLTFYANDTSGNLASLYHSWSYDIFENNKDFNVSTIETSDETFILNITKDSSILTIESFLHYNGTRFSSGVSCENDECIIINNLFIPLVGTSPQENEFFWEINAFNGTNELNVNSSFDNQTASAIIVSLCNGTTILSLNFTVYDEANSLKIRNFSFGGTFGYAVGTGELKNFSIVNLSTDEVDICISPNNSKFEITAQIDYGDQSASYVDRSYFFQDFTINNITQEIFMYLLNTTDSTSFILKVQDQFLLPVENALIEIHRYYPGENVFRIIQIAKTNDEGKSVGFLKTETVDYKFVIKKNGETLLETGQGRIVPESSPFTLNFNTGQDLGEPWSSSNPIANLTSTLDFDKSINVITYSYTDSSGNFTQGRLLVTKNSQSNGSADTVICNDTSILSTAIISCSVGNTTGFYTASGYITRVGEGLDKQLGFQIEDFSSAVGSLGLFFGWFLILVAAFIFKFNEIAGIWAVTITILLINILGLIKFGSVFVSTMIVLAIIITWILEK